MSGFPGQMFNGDGTSLDARVPDLGENTLYRMQCRAMVSWGGPAVIARTWVLRDDATFAGIQAVLRAEAVDLLLAGFGVLILANRPEPAADVRDGLLGALDLCEAEGNA